MGSMPAAERADVILQAPLVFKIRATYAEPKLPAVLLVGPPVPSHGEGLAASAAREGPGSVLALVVGLQGSEVLERARSWVVDVVFAPLGAAVAWQPHQRRRCHLQACCAAERLRALAVL